MDEIINKVATSKLEVFDLEDHSKGTDLDISQYWKAFIKGKEFREHLKTTTGLSTKVNLWLQLQHRCYCPAWVHISYIQLAPLLR
jgi:hypothetical protein